MISVLAVFLAMIGAADLVRGNAGGRDRVRRSGAIAVAAAIGVLGMWGLGRGPEDRWLPLLGVFLVAVWVLADQVRIRHFDRWALGALVAAMIAVLAFGQHLDHTDGWLHAWYSTLAIDALDAVPFDKFALAVGCLLVLQNTANLIVRMVLAHAGPDVMASARTLKGGRILGPLERVLIFAICLSGHFATVGAVVAAKGILRFPEISRADDDGNKAEYVLVGSFVSWVLALLFLPLF